ncbi:MAG: DNA-deoxyinosine glycosylase [Clostridiales bacterium]|nr:DNA-deoxyinosine glycosylase [Clostridiales bacterium]
MNTHGEKIGIRHIVHPFSPIIDGRSAALILGSVPSVKSAEYGFYYMHPQNRFWRIMSDYCGCDLTGASPDYKRERLLEKRIALYDSVYECDITGSSDASVTNVVPVDIKKMIRAYPIRKILCNGALAYGIAVKYNPDAGIPFVKMPSTSPANAAATLEALTAVWARELDKALKA